MKYALVFALAFILSGSAMAQGPCREAFNGARHDGHRRSHRSSDSYLHHASHGHHRYDGYGGYGSYSRGWNDFGYSSWPSYSYIDRDFYGYNEYPGYGYSNVNYAGRPSYRANGVMLGALVGAVIGNNSGDLRHNGWRGAAYGGVAGYLIGSIAENRARRREAASSQQAATPAYREELPAAEPYRAAIQSSSVTASVARPSSSMSSANSLFGR